MSELKQQIAEILRTTPYGNGVMAPLNRIMKAVKEHDKDPFDYVEPCEPDCSKERHAYHQGQWDLATRLSQEKSNE